MGRVAGSLAAVGEGVVVVCFSFTLTSPVGYAGYHY